MTFAPPLPPGRIKLLIAGANPAVRERLRMTLATGDIEVVGSAGTASALVECVIHLRPDVVLMAAPLPDIPCVQVIRMIKFALPTTQIAVIGDGKGTPAAECMVEAGVVAYVLPGISRDSLTHIVRLVSGVGSFVDARLLVNSLEPGVAAPNCLGAAEAALERLSPRERDVLAVLAEGCTNKEIARRINYSVGTVKNIVQSIIEKMGAADRTQAAVMAVRAGIDGMQASFGPRARNGY